MESTTCTVTTTGVVVSAVDAGAIPEMVAAVVSAGGAETVKESAVLVEPANETWSVGTNTAVKE